jgi:PDZ domain-containing protein
MTDSESVSSGTIQKNVSINNAIILAYKTANKEISTNYHGLIVHTVFKDVTYDVKIGDVITKYNDEVITDEKTFREKLVDDVRNKKDIKLTIYRDGSYHDVDYEPIWMENKKSFYIGISYYDYYTINEEETFPKYTINKANTLGPSGGLIQALSVYNAITEVDITKGLKIAGTGTIDINGDVGPIGGIYQKVFTAYFSKADVFFVPVEIDENGEIIKTEGSNYYDALKAYEELGKPESLAFVPVAKFSDAVEYLESLK